ncbi:hypothetical protein CTAYLR_003833 [Chrysophaeum taylorii]|uniref:BZIP domain-containing protein n=1 Tax=Chrysophaeum taylorii TaxID=2483200 RepID=A0AAD7UGA1_9STRA|nr:hypothetical protein CTAYLR_003833 [Chrysophaeum taylorii]
MEQACADGDLEAVRALCDTGDLDRGLLAASAMGRVETVRWLVARGAKHARALYVATKANRLGVVKILAGSEDNGALFAAAAMGSLDLVRVLLSHGASPNTRPSPLDVAVARGHKDVATELLAHNADIRRDAQTNTASILYLVHMRGFLEGLPWLPFLPRLLAYLKPLLQEESRHKFKEVKEAESAVSSSSQMGGMAADDGVEVEERDPSLQTLSAVASTFREDSDASRKEMLRERNREHARLSRQRKRQRLEQLQTENESLSRDCKVARDECSRLRDMLDRCDHENARLRAWIDSILRAHTYHHRPY